MPIITLRPSLHHHHHHHFHHQYPQLHYPNTTITMGTGRGSHSGSSSSSGSGSPPPTGMDPKQGMEEEEEEEEETAGENLPGPHPPSCCSSSTSLDTTSSLTTSSCSLSQTFPSLSTTRVSHPFSSNVRAIPDRGSQVLPGHPSGTHGPIHRRRQTLSSSDDELLSEAGSCSQTSRSSELGGPREGSPPDPPTLSSPPPRPSFSERGGRHPDSEHFVEHTASGRTLGSSSSSSSTSSQHQYQEPGSPCTSVPTVVVDPRTEGAAAPHSPDPREVGPHESGLLGEGSGSGETPPRSGSPGARLLEHGNLVQEEKLVAATLASLNQCGGDPSSIIKQDLRLIIQSRRKAEGKEELRVDFKAPPKEELTEEEWHRALKRRDQNRRAAQRFRYKQRQMSSSLADRVKHLETTHQELLSELQSLETEKLSLLKVVQHHSRVCKDFDFKLKLQQALGYRLTSNPREWTL